MKRGSGMGGEWRGGERGNAMQRLRHLREFAGQSAQVFVDRHRIVPPPADREVLAFDCLTVETHRAKS